MQQDKDGKEKKKTPPSTFVILALVVGFVAVIWADKAHLPKYREEFIKLDAERLQVSNQLTTARILHEDLNHVREVILRNMNFTGSETDHETAFFDSITTFVNDLKLKLVSVKPITPVVTDRVTTYGYDVEVEGDFFKFGELGAKFENSRMIINMESFEVDEIAEQQQQQQQGRRTDRLASEHRGIRVRMRVNTYSVMPIRG